MTTHVIDAIWNMYQVVDQGGLLSESADVPPPWGDNGLTGLRSPSHATISCGMHYGPVRVTIEQHDDSPAPSLSEWTDIVEQPFQVISGEVTFADWNGQPFDALNLTPGEYRLRVHARGRDEGHARTYELTMDDEPVEEHLIQLFPGTGGQRIYKTEDHNGAILRGDTAVGPVEPLPRGRDRMPQAEFEEFERAREVILGLTATMGIPARLLLMELISEQMQAELQLPPPEPQPPLPPKAPARDFAVDGRIDEVLASMPPEMRALVDTDEALRLRNELRTKPQVEPPE